MHNETARNFNLSGDNKEALKIISLYKGEYLTDFEALWATAKRIKYREFFNKALKYS